jgi:hypothetical protein
MRQPARRLRGSDEVRRQSLSTQAALLAEHLDRDVWAGSKLGALSRLAFDAAATRAALDPEDPAIVLDLSRCAAAAAAAFLAATTPGHDAVEARGPGNEPVRVHRDGFDERKLEGPIHWRTGILASVAVGHHEARSVLTSIAPQDLSRLSRGAPVWFASEAAALMATFRGDLDARDRLVCAMGTADPKHIHPMSRSYVRNVVVAELELGSRVVERDAAGFDLALTQALVGHHRYYGRGAPKGIEGELALAPLAMACLGRDCGLRATITTAYVPAWIVERIRPARA